MDGDGIIVYIFTTVNFFLSVPFLGTGIWLTTLARTDCERFLDKPLLAGGVSLPLLCLIQLVSIKYGKELLFGICHWFVKCLILMMLGFAIFGLVVTAGGGGEEVPGRAYKEYRLEHYSKWFRDRMEGNWWRIRSCVQHGGVCRKMGAEVNLPASEFNLRNLSPRESGCCKPPTSCNYTYVSPSNWTQMPSPTNPINRDCPSWSNDPGKLCYDCDSCKAAIANKLKADWRKVSVVNIVFGILMAVVNGMVEFDVEISS